MVSDTLRRGGLLADAGPVTTSTSGPRSTAARRWGHQCTPHVHPCPQSHRSTTLGAPVHTTRAPMPPTSNEHRREQAWSARAEAPASRSEEHTSELPSLMRYSYAVFCLQT